MASKPFTNWTTMGCGASKAIEPTTANRNNLKNQQVGKSANPKVKKSAPEEKQQQLQPPSIVVREATKMVMIINGKAPKERKDRTIEEEGSVPQTRSPNAAPPKIDPRTNKIIQQAPVGIFDLLRTSEGTRTTGYSTGRNK
jgi:hypothetical protein